MKKNRMQNADFTHSYLYQKELILC